AFQTKLFLELVHRQSSLPALRSYIKLYRSIEAAKLARFRSSDAPESTVASVVAECMHLKVVSDLVNSDVHFYLSNDLIKIDEQKREQRNGQYFLSQIAKLQRDVTNTTTSGSFTASDGTQFEDRDQWRKYEFETNYTFKNKKDETLIKAPGQIQGYEYVRLAVLSVFVRNCTNCFFTIAWCDEHMQTCPTQFDLIIVVPCSKQLRTRDCSSIQVSLYTLTDPIIETSSNVVFSTFNAAYHGLRQQFEAAHLEPENNHWAQVYDFNDPNKTNENWTLNHDTVEPWVIPLDQFVQSPESLGPLENPVPANSTPIIAHDSSLQSFSINTSQEAATAAVDAATASFEAPPASYEDEFVPAPHATDASFYDVTPSTEPVYSTPSPVYEAPQPVYEVPQPVYEQPPQPVFNTPMGEAVVPPPAPAHSWPALNEFEAKLAAEVEAKRVEEERLIRDVRSKAEEELDKYYGDRTDKLAHRAATNRELEEEKKKSQELLAEMASEKPWNRVTDLVDTNVAVKPKTDAGAYVRPMHSNDGIMKVYATGARRTRAMTCSTLLTVAVMDAVVAFGVKEPEKLAEDIANAAVRRGFVRIYFENSNFTSSTVLRVEEHTSVLEDIRGKPIDLEAELELTPNYSNPTSALSQYGHPNQHNMAASQDTVFLLPQKLGLGLRAGTLKKASLKDANVWRSRWFVLKDDKLYYCKSEFNQRDITAIPLLNAQIVKQDALVPHCFELHTSRRVYRARSGVQGEAWCCVCVACRRENVPDVIFRQFCSATDDSMMAWIHALHREIRLAAENQMLTKAESFIVDEMFRDFMASESMASVILLDTWAECDLFRRNGLVRFQSQLQQQQLQHQQLNHMPNHAVSSFAAGSAQDEWDHVKRLLLQYIPVRTEELTAPSPACAAAQKAGAHLQTSDIDLCRQSLHDNQKHRRLSIAMDHDNSHVTDFPSPNLFLNVQQDILRALEEGPFQRYIAGRGYTRIIDRTIRR
ncbi:hypothetical protein DYB32_007356, partial [Aphanomyces invadans]